VSPGERAIWAAAFVAALEESRHQPIDDDERGLRAATAASEAVGLARYALASAANSLGEGEAATQMLREMLGAPYKPPR
jgi:hypothetical protein